MATFALAPFAMAATTSSPTIKGGPLILLPPTIQTDFPAITLNGQLQTLNATLSNWSIIDATGTGNGWHVTAQATPFTEAGVSNNPLTLPTGSLTLSGTRNVSAVYGSTPVDATNGPILLNQTAALDSTIPVTIISAKKGYGMGWYNVSEPTNGLTLTLAPASTKVDTTNHVNDSTPYSSTLTFSVITGP
ncbi:WxL domain-containing protein [Bacillus sp. BRMEA1]|uniref:WxL domain-containing protein n=1 Tax=Neobacillus endophyticus TaxID=2738405 RepID=UPI001564ED59|nr:WxL domain-containing protein [Neobacillus endophyticus]NRD80938.1 WxL domain-containing protein [Neobacillus endophyticus]